MLKYSWAVALVCLGAAPVSLPEAPEWPLPAQREVVYALQQGRVSMDVPDPLLNSDYLRAHQRQYVRQTYAPWMDSLGLTDEAREGAVQLLLERDWVIAEGRMWIRIASMKSDPSVAQWRAKLDEYAIQVFAKTDAAIKATYGAEALDQLVAHERDFGWIKLLNDVNKALVKSELPPVGKAHADTFKTTVKEYWSEIPVPEDLFKDYLSDADILRLAVKMSSYLNQEQIDVVRQTLQRRLRPQATIWLLKQPGVGFGRAEHKLRPDSKPPVKAEPASTKETEEKKDA